MTTCEERISVTLLPARLAMNRWTAGGMTLSWVGIRYQEGMLFHAGAPLGPLSPSTEPGRCVTAMRRVSDAGRSAANTAWNFSAAMYPSVPSPPPGSG